MAIIANLDILFGARTEKAERKINNAGSTLDGFKKKLGAIAFAATSTVVAVLGIANAAEKVNAQFQRLDDLGKRSRSLGLDVSELQAFDLAGRLSGIEGFGRELSVLQRRIGEAAAFGGRAADSFAAININVEKIKNQRASQQFLTVAENLGKVANQAERARIAQELFGRGGQGVLNLVQSGAAAYRESTEFLEKYNIALTETDVSAIEKSNDQFLKLRTLSEGLFQKFAIQLAPAFTEVADRILTAAERGDTFEKLLIATAAAAELTADGLLVMVDVFETLIEFAGSVEGKFLLFVAATAAIVLIVPTFITAVRGIIATLKALQIAQALTLALQGPQGWAILAGAAAAAAASIAVIELTMQGVTDRMTENTAAAQKAAKAVDGLDNGYKKLGDDANDAGKKINDLTQALLSQQDKLASKAAAIRKEVRTPLETFQQEVNEIGALFANRLISADIASRAISKRLSGLSQASNTGRDVLNLNRAARNSQAEFSTLFTQRQTQAGNVDQDILKATEFGNQILNEIRDGIIKENLPERQRRGGRSFIFSN